MPQQRCDSGRIDGAYAIMRLSPTESSSPSSMHILELLGALLDDGDGDGHGRAR
jgi:hypothetical protein